MKRTDLFHKMNRHPKVVIISCLVVGYFLNLVYEYANLPKPVLALIVFLAAGVAGLAIDLGFTKGEEEAGEID